MKDLLKELNNRISRVQLLEETKKKKKREIRITRNRVREVGEAIALAQEAATQVQERIQIHISNLASMALQATIGEDLELEVDFVERRNRTEADIFFLQEGNRIDPLTAAGGGPVDLASLALRFSFLTLKRPRLRQVVFLDEPLKWLKGRDMPQKGAELIKEMAEELGFQVIMVSHDPELISGADKIFKIGETK